MFKSIRLKNFKAYKDSGEVPFAPLTILIGPNNSGKSTFLHALLMLKQTFEDASETPLVTKGPYVNLGRFQDILHGKEKQSDAIFGIDLQVRGGDQTYVYKSKSGNRMMEIPMEPRLGIEFCFDHHANDIAVHRCTLSDSARTLIDAQGDGATWTSDVFPHATTTWKPKIDFTNFMPEILFDLPHGKKVTRKHWEFYNSLQFQAHAWLHQFSGHVSAVGPHRQHIPWHSAKGTRVSSEAGQALANIVESLGNNTPLPRTGKTLLQLTKHWTCDKLKVLKNLKLQSLDKADTFRMLLGDEVHGFDNLNVAAMGEGVSQLLYIVMNVVAVGIGDSLLIEQPEIHLHPAMQADLGDLFVEVVKDNKRQLIVETHSEHLLLRVRRHVAMGKLKPEQVSILFVECKPTGRTVRRLDMNERGSFDSWPDGFFDERYQEVMSLSEAASRKPRKNVLSNSRN